MPETNRPARTLANPIFRIIEPDPEPPLDPPSPSTHSTGSGLSAGSGSSAFRPETLDSKPGTLPPAAFSLFPSARSTTPERSLTVADLVALIRTPAPRVAGTIIRARQALADGDTERFAALKRELPAVSIAGTFSARNNKGLLAHSGLMPIDLDHLDPAAMAEAKTWLRDDPHCAFLYTSPSGSGLKGAYCIDTRPIDDAGHKIAFAAVRNHLRERHHLDLDPACKDVARLAFLSHDPECHHNPHAVPLIVANWADLSTDPFTPPSARSRDREIVEKPTTPTNPFDSSLSRSRPAAQSAAQHSPTSYIPNLTSNIEPVAGDPASPTSYIPNPTSNIEPATGDPASQTSYIPHQTSYITVASGDEFLLYLDNDSGRAARFVDRWRDEIRYVTDRALWLVWEGRWKIDRSRGIIRRAITLANEIYAEAAALPAPKRAKSKTQPAHANLSDGPDPDARNPKAAHGSGGNADLERQAATMRQAAKWGNRRIIESNVELAATHASIQVETAHLDSDPWLLGTPNAIIDLRTGNAYSHRPEYLITLSTRAAFDHTATAPRWERFIEEIYPDPALRRYLWKALGYALTGITSEKCFHFLTGIGNNGKSKLCEAIEYVAGDYAGHAAKGLLAANDKGQYPLREAATIVGKRIIIGPETDARERLNVSVIKSLTGHGDTMRAANLYENQFDFIPVGKLFIMGNHKPTITDTGAAIWNRVRLIPHDIIFPPEKQDKTLGEKLRQEASGILNWLIEGCLLWQREGLTPPDKVRAAVEQYRTEEDTLGEFIDECIRMETGTSTSHAEVYLRYTEWARESGLYRTVTKKTLAKLLREKGWGERRTPQSSVNWIGITLAE